MKLSRIFSYFRSARDNFDKEQNKVELMGCPYNGQNCHKQLAAINKNYFDSARYQKEKNYLKAIHLLRNAYLKTNELQQLSCANCAELFRETINNSMENIHNDLQKMTTGVFRNKRYHEVYLEAAKALKEFDRSN